MSNGAPQIHSLDQLLSRIWEDYCRINPSALSIYNLFANMGEVVNNDHIALRTIRHPRLGIELLASQFKRFGYKEGNEYTFKEKKLYARHYEHNDKSLPKIFISELELEKVGPFTRKIMNECAEAIPESVLSRPDLCFSGRHWPLTTTTYQRLAQESEYASWFAALGFRANHFTVFVNDFKKIKTLEEVNNLLLNKGHILNSSGGLIKGNPSVYLEQSSTMAREIVVKFDDARMSIPGCYYEFAKRYPLPNGTLYQGFVAASADKIFESTSRNKDKAA